MNRYDAIDLFTNIGMTALLIVGVTVSIILLRRIVALARTLSLYAVVLEEDSRRTRHAVKNLAVAMRLENAVDALFDEHVEQEEVKDWLSKTRRSR